MKIHFVVLRSGNLSKSEGELSISEAHLSSHNVANSTSREVFESLILKISHQEQISFWEPAPVLFHRCRLQRLNKTFVSSTATSQVVAFQTAANPSTSKEFAPWTSNAAGEKLSVCGGKGIEDQHLQTFGCMPSAILAFQFVLLSNLQDRPHMMAHTETRTRWNSKNCNFGPLTDLAILVFWEMSMNTVLTQILTSLCCWLSRNFMRRTGVRVKTVDNG